jgi:YesN/AraC family two-component response regulator
VELHKKLNRLLKEYTQISPYREYQVSAYLTQLPLDIVTTSDSYRQAQEKMPPQLRDIILYINAHYYQEISLSYLSDTFAFSKYHLCRCFKKYTGYTINEYITQLRIEQARELLRTTSLSAYQIGAIVGIPDDNYFYRLFRKQVGISPHRYRKQPCAGGLPERRRLCR